MKKIDAKAITEMLRIFNAEERTYAVWAPTRMLWHRLLRSYLKQSPLQFLKRKVDSHSGYLSFSPENTTKAYNALLRYMKDPGIPVYVSHLLESFEKLLAKSIDAE